MLQPIPSISKTIWTPTVQDAWLRWYFASRRGQPQHCWQCEDVEEGHFLLASLPSECVE